MTCKQITIFAAALTFLAARPAIVHAQTAAPVTPPAPTTPGDNTTIVPTIPPPPAAAPPPTAAPPEVPAASPEVPAAPAALPRPRFRIGPAVGVFFPNQSKTRNRFGETWFSFGLGLGSVGRITEKGTLAGDLNVFYNRRGDNHAFFAPLGLGYRVALAPGTDIVPYAGLSADIVFADITSNPENVRNSFQVGGGGSASLGVNFGDTAYVEARYYGLSRLKGFDFSGLSLSTGYRF